MVSNYIFEITLLHFTQNLIKVTEKVASKIE